MEKRFMEKSLKRLVIIDGKSVFYRGYYAMPNLRTKDNIPTGGVYGFAMMALEVISRLKPDYIAVAWDKPKTNIRKRLDLYPEYKAGRKPAPADFYQQIPILHEILNALGWPLYELDDYEADDIMGSLAKQAQDQGVETILITSDLDLLQVIDKSIKVYILKKGLSNIELYSPESFRQKHQISVDQFLDLKALKGDTSDNIPGVPGIGEKGATELLLQFKDLDNIYKNIELIKPNLRDKLREGKKLAYLSKELARIYIDAPIKIDFEAMDGRNLNSDKLIKLLNKLQFKSLVNKIADIMPSESIQRNNIQKSIIALHKINIVNNNVELNKLISLVKNEVYIFTRSYKKHGIDPAYIFIFFDKFNYYCLDLKKLDTKFIKKLFLKIDYLKGFDLKETFNVLLELNIIKLPKVKFDIQIAEFSISSFYKNYSLNDLAIKYLDYDDSRFDDLDNQQLIARSSAIFQIMSAIEKIQKEDMKKIPKLDSLLNKIEWPMISILAEMEKTGIKVDLNYFKKLDKKVEDLMLKLEQTIYAQANVEFNISSPSQLANILFSDTHLNLPKVNIKKTKSGYSTAATELNKLLGIHPIIDNILQFREVSKIQNTYVDTLPKQVDSVSRIHTTFSLTTATTGRLSSLDPNLQNIPIRSELGKSIRGAFVADEDKIFISIDYSQFELRLAAFLAKDKGLIDQFNDGLDIHSLTAAQIYNRELEDVTEQMRRAAKIINFGILYGMSSHGLSVASGMTINQASDFIKKYKEIRKPLFDYMNRTIQDTRNKGYSETYFGRRRYFPNINSNNYILRQADERAAVNMPIQGTEADLMKMAMISFDRKLKQEAYDCKILLQIHDSILVECDTKIHELISKYLRECLENVYSLPIKLKADIKSGYNWGEI